VGFAELVSRVEQFLGNSPRPTAAPSAVASRPRPLAAAPIAPPPARSLVPPADEPRAKAASPNPAKTEAAGTNLGGDESIPAIDRLRNATAGRMLLSALGSASATIDKEALHLNVAPAQQSFLESERDALAANAEKAFGRKLKVVIAAGADEVDDTAPAKPRTPRPAVAVAGENREAALNPVPSSSTKAPNKSALKSKAMADPVVGRTLDMFGGTLVDVKPLASAIESLDENEDEGEGERE
jgi:hypothetical protein